MFDLQTAIQQAKHVTFMTGAGVSTASGIPDYRSKGGLYADQVDPEYALSIDNLQAHHEDFHKFVVNNMYFPAAKPNVIHEKMATITNQKGTIVTQNVDGVRPAQSMLLNFMATFIAFIVKLVTSILTTRPI